MDVAGTSAVVTGAASGLGAATCAALAQAGARVVGIDVVPFEERGSVESRVADVTDPDAVAAAVAAASAHAPLRVAVNCAGVATPGRLLGRKGPLDLDVVRRVIDVNLIGTLNVMRLAAAAMATNEPVSGGRGVLVNTSSIAAWDGQAGQLAYAASKGAVAAMTLPAARDLAGLHVRCVAIAPGVFATPMVDALDQDVIGALAAEVVEPSRLGHPDEFAQLVLAAVANDYLNGEVIRLDGALRMR